MSGSICCQGGRHAAVRLSSGRAPVSLKKARLPSNCFPGRREHKCGSSRHCHRDALEESAIASKERTLAIRLLLGKAQMSSRKEWLTYGKVPVTRSRQAGTTSSTPLPSTINRWTFAYPRLKHECSLFPADMM